MEKKEFKDFTNEELLTEKEKIQYNKTVNATLVGFCFGIFIYSAVYNGLSFFTLFPLLLAYLFIKNGKKIKNLTEELNSRNLQ